MTYYLGIDQSYTSTGLVGVNEDGQIITQEIISSLKADGDYFTRAKIVSEQIVYKTRVMDACSDHDLKISCEGLAFGMRGTTLQQLAGLQFMIVNGLREEGFEVNIIAPSSVKKFATGSGKAKKEDMWEALPEKVKKMFENIPKSQGREDLVDAYWISMKTKG